LRPRVPQLIEILLTRAMQSFNRISITSRSQEQPR
jgi:hypothetical protein